VAETTKNANICRYKYLHFPVTCGLAIRADLRKKSSYRRVSDVQIFAHFPSERLFRHIRFDVETDGIKKNVMEGKEEYFIVSSS